MRRTRDRYIQINHSLASIIISIFIFYLTDSTTLINTCSFCISPRYFLFFITLITGLQIVYYSDTRSSDFRPMILAIEPTNNLYGLLDLVVFPFNLL
jgi:disulfide bond formation protein DsbB